MRCVRLLLHKIFMQKQSRSLSRKLVVFGVFAISAAACGSVQQQVDGVSTGATPASPEADVETAVATRSAGEGVFTSSQATRGERRFRQVCTSCHSANEFTGGSFARRWSGDSVGDAFEFISATMPQSNPGSLSPEEYVEIISFFLRENGFAPGESELPATLSELHAIVMP